MVKKDYKIHKDFIKVKKIDIRNSSIELGADLDKIMPPQIKRELRKFGIREIKNTIYLKMEPKIMLFIVVAGICGFLIAYSLSKKN